MHHSIFFVVDLNELPETTRIVVVYCLSIAECLQNDKRTSNEKKFGYLVGDYRQLLDKDTYPYETTVR